MFSPILFKLRIECMYGYNTSRRNVALTSRFIGCFSLFSSSFLFHGNNNKSVATIFCASTFCLYFQFTIFKFHINLINGLPQSPRIARFVNKRISFIGVMFVYSISFHSIGTHVSDIKCIKPNEVECSEAKNRSARTKCVQRRGEIPTGRMKIRV